MIRFAINWLFCKMLRHTSAPMKGKIWMADDFDELPDDILSLFTGEEETHATIDQFTIASSSPEAAFSTSI